MIDEIDMLPYQIDVIFDSKRVRTKVRNKASDKWVDVEALKRMETIDSIKQKLKNKYVVIMG